MLHEKFHASDSSLSGANLVWKFLHSQVNNNAIIIINVRLINSSLCILVYCNAWPYNML
jgi:hypothetical protein